jgi:hypothetical protein
MNKNFIIVILSMLLLLVTVFLIIEYNKEIIVPKPIVETIIEEKIVYLPSPQKKIEPVKLQKTKEVKKETVVEKPVVYELPEVEVPLTKDNEYIITQTRDNKGRFTIALTSTSKPSKKAFYDRKIILESEIEDGEYIGKFLFLVPPILLENISELSIKITDAISNRSYIETAYCLEGIEPKYKYSMNISFSYGFSCYVQEMGKAFKMPKLSEKSTQTIKEIFNKSEK